MTLTLLLVVPSLAQSYTTPTEAACVSEGDRSPVPDLGFAPPTRNPTYDRYVQQIHQVDATFSSSIDPHVELGEGLSGVVGTHGGTVFTFDWDGDPTTNNRFVEHWFLDTPPGAFDGAGWFGFEAQGAVDAVDMTEVSHDWEDGSYLYMDVTYKSPDMAALKALNHPYSQFGEVQGYAFDVFVNGSVSPNGYLLRERHPDKWVDFWLFESTFALLNTESNGVAITSIDVVRRPGLPANANAFFVDVDEEGDFVRYAKVAFRVRPACAYEDYVEMGAFASTIPNDTGDDSPPVRGGSLTTSGPVGSGRTHP